MRLFLFVFVSGPHLSLSAQCALSCNDGLQVSLDPSGQALITWQLMAPTAGSSCPGPLSVTLYNHIGQPLPNPLTCNQIGQTVTAKVQHNSSGNFCTGTLEVFDALAPVLSNCTDKFVFCNEDPSPESVGFPLATDNCTASSDLNFSHIDNEIPLGCGVFQNGHPVLKRIERSWTVSDDHGNSSNCLQKIWLKHITFADIDFPANLDNISAPALACGQDPEDLDLTGQPSVNGVPVGASPECEIGTTYTDQKIIHCAPAGFTLLRNWTVVDFCSGTFSNRIQIIKVQDNEPPVLIAPDNLTIGTDGFYCTGSLTLPQAVVSDNCSAVSVLPTWAYGSGFGPFLSVAEGQHLVTYTATDACGNSTTATFTVTVVDSSPPQAICASDLQVSLTSNGVGYVNAATVNQGSFDNCGPVFLSLSRDEIEYTPQVQVNCADQAAPIMMTLRVTDAVGLENFCQLEVTVRDFLKPSIQCPANLTLTCLQDYNNLNLTGQATATDNCALQSIAHQDIVNIQPCNIGSVTRWWIATDSAANTKSCSQLISVQVVNSTTVTFPANVTTPGCGDPADLLPASTGEPLIGGQSCSPLSVNYTDQIFNIAAPACFRIFRAWKVIDHCVYNPNGGSAGIWEHTQIIDVVDHSAPSLSIPADITVAADPFNCLGTVTMPDVTAVDCSNQVAISNDSPYSGTGHTNNASGQYPLGVYFVTFTAEDGCGNTARQTLRITVKDLTPPTAVCLPGLSVQIQSSGLVVLDPHHFDGGCSDFCSPQNSLLFSIAPAVFDCQQIGLFPVVLTVQDTAGNTSSCSTQVMVLDPQNVCGGGLEHQVSGSIRTETGLPVNNIEVSITAVDQSWFNNTDTTGYFEIDSLPTGVTYNLKPYNNAKWLNGVTTYDLVLISKHILGTEPLNTPFKMLAADANRSNSITTFDVVQLRKIILGILDSLPNNTSWRFVDSSFVFPDPYNPFASPIPEEIVFNPLSSSQYGQNFIGLKVGDVNGSSNPAQARALDDTLYLELPNLIFQSGETMAIPISLDNWTALEGFQFELNIAPEMVELERIEFARPDLLGPSHIAHKTDGSLAVSWDNAWAKPLGGIDSGSQMFTLYVRAKANTDLPSVFGISPKRLSPEAYRQEKEEQAAIGLRFEEIRQSKSNTGLDIYPNPTTGTFTVQTPFATTECRLRLLDLNGKMVWEKTGVLSPEVVITTALAPGMYLVEMQSQEKTAVGKVVVGE